MSDESYENLLNLDISVSLHQRHLRFLVTEIIFTAICTKATVYETNSVHSFGITFPILLNPVPQYLNFKDFRTLGI